MKPASLESVEIAESMTSVRVLEWLATCAYPGQTVVTTTTTGD